MFPLKIVIYLKFKTCLKYWMMFLNMHILVYLDFYSLVNEISEYYVSLHDICYPTLTS